jgi:adenosylhomocysteine nucleosidase
MFKQGDIRMIYANSIRRMMITIIIISIPAIILLSGCCNKCLTGQPYLILYAFEAEGELLSREMTIQDSAIVLGRTVYIGTLAGKEIVLAESGIGMTNAAMTTQRMIDYYNPKGIIFSGIAGAIDSSVHIGDIVVCQIWQTHDYGYYGKDGFQVTGISVYDIDSDSLIRTTQFNVDEFMMTIAEQISGTDVSLGKIGERTPSLTVGGVGVSGNCFIDSREKRQWLQEEFDALITDMESAGVGQVCAVNGLPFIVFRSASDLAGGSGSETAGDELEQFFNIAADNSSKVVMKFLEDLP